MKLSNEMREVLNNFSKINDNLVIGAEPGVVRTVATSRNIMAKASITEDFPFKFGIYDLNEFLSCLNMFEDPTLAFEQKYVNITDGQQAIKYWFSEPENLTTSNKEIKMPVCEVKFTLTDDQLSKIRKASSALKADQLVIKHNREGGVFIKAVVTDVENPSSNQYSLNIANCNIDTDENFEFVFNINNFKFNQADEYVFEVSSKMISTVKAGDIQYWVALDKSSKYGV